MAVKFAANESISKGEKADRVRKNRCQVSEKPARTIVDVTASYVLESPVLRIEKLLKFLWAIL